MHKTDGAQEAFEDLIKTSTTQGQVMVAVQYLSRYNDRYYGQWLLMNHPFRSQEDLWHADADLVPDDYRCLASCLRLQPAYWRDMSAVRADLELEGYKDAVIATVLAMLQANTSLVDRYFAGELDKADDLPWDFGGPGEGVVQCRATTSPCGYQ
jgi:hypothetical protein